MHQILLIVLFIIGALFFNASHIPAWFTSGEKPNHPYWKAYASVAFVVWVLMFILANAIL